MWDAIVKKIYYIYSSVEVAQLVAQIVLKSKEVTELS